MLPGSQAFLQWRDLLQRLPLSLSRVPGVAVQEPVWREFAKVILVAAVLAGSEHPEFAGVIPAVAALGEWERQGSARVIPVAAALVGSEHPESAKVIPAVAARGVPSRLRLFLPRVA